MAGCTSLAQGTFSQDTYCFIVLPVMAGNLGCFTAAKAVPLGKVPSLAFLLSGQTDGSQWAEYDIFPFFLQMLCTQMAVSLSGPSSPKSEHMPTCNYSSLTTARSAVAHRCNTGNCPI